MVKPARQIAIGVVVVLLGGVLGGIGTYLLTPQPSEEAVETFFIGSYLDPTVVDLDPRGYEVWVDQNEELPKMRLVVVDGSGKEVINTTMTGTTQRGSVYFGSFESDGSNHTFVSNVGATVYLTGNIEPWPEDLTICGGFSVCFAGFVIVAIGFVRRFFREPEPKQSRQEEGPEETED